MYLLSASHGQRESAWPSASGAPTEWRHGHEVAVRAEHLEGAAPHPGHDPHRDGHVGRIGDLHADVGDRRTERTHREGDDVHGPAAHRAAEELGQDLAHLGGIPPVVGRAGVGLAGRADERPVLDPRHVARVGVGPVAVRPLGVGELGEGALVDQELTEPVVLLGRAVAPLDLVRLGECRHLVHPFDQLLVVGGGHGRWFLLGVPNEPGPRPIRGGRCAGRRSIVVGAPSHNGRQGRWNAPIPDPAHDRSPGRAATSSTLIERLRVRFEAAGRRRSAAG